MGGDVQPAGARERLYPAQSAGQRTQRTGVKSHIILPVNTLWIAVEEMQKPGGREKGGRTSDEQQQSLSERRRAAP